MNVVQLCHRIGRRARGSDFTKLSLSEKGDLLECANSALQTVYGLLPTYFKERTQGFLLQGPTSMEIPVIPLSSAVPDGTFYTSDLGKSVVIAGDGNWNQVIATNRLLNPYLGSNAGTQTATLYGDACYSDDYPFERVIGNPTFPNQGQTLVFNQNITNVSNSPGWFLQQTTGIPQMWWKQMLGNSQGEEPLLVLRFSPAPNIDYAVDVRISYWPKRLTMADYNRASTIFVPDQFLEKCLIPLALRELLSSAIWDKQGGEDDVRLRAQRAEEFLALVPGQVAAPANTVATPYGY